MDDFSGFQSTVSAALVATTRSASQLANEDLAFHRSLDPEVATALDRQNGRLLALTTGLFGSATTNTETVRPPSLKDVDAIDGNWRAVVDVVDSLLERADTALDEFTGAVRRLSPGASERAANAAVSSRFAKFAASFKQPSQEIQKPQLLFEHVPTNKEIGPFTPLLEKKPHARVHLATTPISSGQQLPLVFPHPYQPEIEEYRYPNSIYTPTDPVPPTPFDSTSATFVDTEEALDDMLQELRSAKEIAIDLEHHDQRSFIGIVCLMQISTRDKDWIIDTLKPWRRKLQVLNEVFADPGIIKVLQGAFMDIVWLQRDFGLYVVGLFDTHYAARALGYPGGSLAFLLKKFVNVDAQKQYQMADWRVRPLPEYLVDYARSDTHYLLYIFDCMRNELIERSNFAMPDHEGDKIWEVLQRSSETALQTYEIPTYDSELGQGPMGWHRLLSRTPVRFSKEQFAVFRAVHQWRDEVAREQDDSVNWVLPNHRLFSIAREMPGDRVALLSLIQPATQTVRLRSEELLSVVLKAKAEKNQPEMAELLDQIEPHSSGAFDSKNISNNSAAISFPKLEVAKVVTDGNSTTTGDLRSLISKFWGSSLGGSGLQQRSVSTVPDVSLAIPLPPLRADVFAELSTEVPSQSPVRPAGERQPEVPENEYPDDDLMILKQLGKKRKRSDDAPKDTDAMATQKDEVTVPDEDQDRLNSKLEKRRAKKAEKIAKKAAVASMDEQFGDAPFDYTSAPSILEPPKETRDEMKARKRKEFNPYAKALDTPKGLPRAQKEKGGRSMTYK